MACECDEEPVALTEDNGSIIDSSFLSEDGVVILEPGIMNVMHSSISTDEEIKLGYTVLQDSTILDDTLPMDPAEIVQDIVQFIQPNSFFTRSPQSHTCVCVLEVPNNYTSYLELAEEFANALDANIRVMDIA